METLTCPKCQGPMRTYERSGVTVDQCTECRGIFLDRGELERLADAEQAFGAPTSAPPVQQPRYEEKRYDDKRYEDKRYDDRRSDDSRRYDNNRYDNDRYRNQQHPRKRKKSFLDDLFD